MIQFYKRKCLFEQIFLMLNTTLFSITLDKSLYCKFWCFQTQIMKQQVVLYSKLRVAQNSKGVTLSCLSFSILSPILQCILMRGVSNKGPPALEVSQHESPFPGMGTRCVTKYIFVSNEQFEHSLMFAGATSTQVLRYNTVE